MSLSGTYVVNTFSYSRITISIFLLIHNIHRVQWTDMYSLMNSRLRIHLCNPTQSKIWNIFNSTGNCFMHSPKGQLPLKVTITLTFPIMVHLAMFCNFMDTKNMYIRHANVLLCVELLLCSVKCNHDTSLFHCR